MTYLLRQIPSFLAGVIAFAALLAAPLRAGSLPPDLDSYIENGMKQWKIPGLAIAVVKDGKVVLSKGYGVREFGKPDKVDENTLFAIGSATKAFTAAAMGTLVDARKINWDTRVVDIWPQFKLSDPGFTQDIRISDLLSNHSGLSEEAESLWYGTTYNRTNIIRRLADIPFEAGLRYQFQYRNTPFLVAGQLIPIINGLTWDEYLTKVIFRPLGMTRTSPTEAGIEAKSNVGQPHILDYTGTPLVVPYRDMYNIAPAGSIVSSVKDLSKWVTLNLNGGQWNGQSILKPATIAFMQSGQTPVFVPPGAKLNPPVELVSYCMGWLTESYQGRRIVWHNGDIDGMAAWVGFDYDQGLGIAILNNLNQGEFRRALFYKIIDGYEGNPPADLSPTLLAARQAKLVARNADEKLFKQLRAKPVAPALPLEQYVGTYRSEALGDGTIALSNGSLVYTHSPLQTLDLVCRQGNSFLGKYTTVGEDLRSGKSPIEFTVENGAVVSFTQDGAFTYRKVGTAPIGPDVAGPPDADALLGLDDGFVEH